VLHQARNAGKLWRSTLGRLPDVEWLIVRIPELRYAPERFILNGTQKVYATTLELLTGSFNIILC